MEFRLTLATLAALMSDDIAAMDLPANTEITGDYNDCYDNKELLATMGLR